MSKARSFEEVQNWAAKFAHEWKDIPGDERQWGQQFVRDLLRIYGLTETRAAFYEQRAKRSSTGKQGYIDALVPGKLAIEMKSEGRDLEEAERQALDYLDDLSDSEMPTHVLTSDFRSFRLLSIQSGQIIGWPLAEFKQHAESLSFLAGYRQRNISWEDQEQASIKAARLMASLYEGLASSGYDDHHASVFLVRTVFALYADDSGLWERDLFLEFLETRTSEDGSDLGAQMSHLFQVLRTPNPSRPTTMTGLLTRFPYVNGGLFDEPVEMPFFTADMRLRMLEACYFNWANISPAVFGSLFQAVKNKKARRSLGEHYTTEKNILRVIEPMFLDELEMEFAEKRNKPQALRNLRQRLGNKHFLDPACGCGNFLVVAYKRLRNLELRIIERIQQLDRERGRISPAVEDEGLAFLDDQIQVRVRNFHGIEIEDWPARIANTALHLAEHQANQEMEARLGDAPELLPLDKVETIHTGNALRIDWEDILPPSAEVTVMGNPPFLGHATRTHEQAQELRDVWQRQDIGRLDYVTGWYKKTLDYFRSVPGGRWGFVSTNSVSQGEPVPALFRSIFEQGWRIRFAHRTFKWTSEAPGAAQVHCVIVGFDRERSPRARLFSYSNLREDPTEESVGSINGYLVDGPRVFVEQRRHVLSPDLPPFTYGSMPRGTGLIVEPDDYESVANDPIANKYLRPFKMGNELIHNELRWCLWMEELEPADLNKSKVLRQRVESVRESRLKSKAPETRKMADTPHLFGQRSQPNHSYLAAPAVFSEERRFATVARLDATTIAGNKIFKADDKDGLAFAVMSSSMFITWQKTVGGRLESRCNFSNTVVWNNLPLPRLEASQRSEIIAAGQHILRVRENYPERSLAEHYNALVMDPELLRAHQKLDRLVDRAFGSTGRNITEKERQKALFIRYAEMTGLHI